MKSHESECRDVSKSKPILGIRRGKKFRKNKNNDIKFAIFINKKANRRSCWLRASWIKLKVQFLRIVSLIVEMLHFSEIFAVFTLLNHRLKKEKGLMLVVLILFLKRGLADRIDDAKRQNLVVSKKLSLKTKICGNS